MLTTALTIQIVSYSIFFYLIGYFILYRVLRKSIKERYQYKHLKYTWSDVFIIMAISISSWIGLLFHYMIIWFDDFKYFLRRSDKTPPKWL